MPGQARDDRLGSWQFHFSTADAAVGAPEPIGAAVVGTAIGVGTNTVGATVGIDGAIVATGSPGWSPGTAANATSIAAIPSAALTRPINGFSNLIGSPTVLRYNLSIYERF